MNTLRQSLRDILLEAKAPDADETTLVNRALAVVLSGRLADADRPVAAKVAIWALGTENFMPENLLGLPPPVIRAMLRRPGAAHDRLFFLSRCVGDATPDAQLTQRWKMGLKALEVLRVAGIYRLSSRKNALLPLSALSRNARVVAAARETALACQQVPAALLAILMLDGSARSIAALEPRLQASADSAEELDLMRELEPLGRGSPPVKALLARVKASVVKRSQGSGALAVLSAAQIEGVTAFWLQLEVRSVEQVKPYPLMPATAQVRVALRIDSRDLHWFWAIVDASPSVPALWFGEQGVTLDKKKLPVKGCAAHALPAWFAELATKAKLTWDWGGMSFKTSLRAKKRTRLEAWLRGG